MINRLKATFHLYCLDSSLIDLSLRIFPWAHYAKGKAAVKLRVALDHHGNMPAFATITQGHTSDLEVARSLSFPRGCMVTCDRGYLDYAWFKTLTGKGVFFVTRPKKDAVYQVVERQSVDKKTGVTSDEIVLFIGVNPEKIGTPLLHRIGYRDAETRKHYVFITNVMHLEAKTIADIYKQRWQIELFSK